MRVLLKVSIPTEAGNQGIKNEMLPKTIKGFMERAKPEAAYFVGLDGQRTALFFVDLKDPSDIPSLCEPFFMNLQANVEITPAMNVEDMQTGVGKAMKEAGG